jgi:inner membrane protein
MDNLCHTLAGAALGEASLKRRTAFGMATLMIASNLPDIDVAVFATDTLAMSFRRGWTHGVLGLAVLPAVLAGLVLLWGRWRPPTRPGSPPVRRGSVLLLAYVGTWLHVFMDFLNSYGVRLLMPFSDRWFYGDALYIVDPILYVLLGGAVVVSRWRARRGKPGAQAARVAIGLAAAYMALMLAANQWARAAVRDGLVRAGQPAATRFMVTPVLANPFRREVIIDTGDRYEKGFVWFEPTPHFRPAGYGVVINRSHRAAERAAASPRFAAFLRWSRFPFFVVDQRATQTIVYINDYRYSGPGARDGWAGQSVVLPLE